MRAWRLIQNLGSLRGFAKTIGWPANKLSRIERGVQPLKEDDRAVLIKALGLTVLQFYGEFPTRAAG